MDDIHGLRPVRLNSKLEGCYPYMTGSFHGFFQIGDRYDGEMCVAIIEMPDGQIIQVDADYVIFTDREGNCNDINS